MHTKARPKSKRAIWKKASKLDTWFAVVLKALAACDPPAPLSKLYELIEPHPKTRGRKHWQAKVRQTLEASDKFVRVGPGTWDLASQHSAKALNKFERQRRERYPTGSESES
jgi:hypothetical protein